MIFPFLFSFPLEMSRITETFYFSICDLLTGPKQISKGLENLFPVSPMLVFKILIRFLKYHILSCVLSIFKNILKHTLKCDHKGLSQ